MVRNLLISFFAAGLPAIFAAQVRGVVLDPSSRPVPDAAVSCGGSTSTTGPDGRFAMETAGACTASITREGFEVSRPALEPDRPVTVVLTISGHSDRVVVSATRTPTSLEESGVSATVYTASDLAERQTPVLAELLRSAPGISIAGAGRRGSITSAFTRGAQSTATLFLLDGVPLNEPGGQINLANLSTAGIDRVEVIRGAESALFGAEAAGGVVQLFSMRGNGESRWPRGSVAYERGNFQTDRWIANINGGLADRLDYSLTADQFHTVGMFANDYHRNTTGTAAGGLRLTKSTRIRAVFRQFDAVVGNPGQPGWGAFDSDAYGGDRNSALTVGVDDVRNARFVQRFTFNYSRLRNVYENSVTDAPVTVAALVRRTDLPSPRVYLVRQVPPGFNSQEIPSGVTLAGQTLYDFPSSFAGVFDRKNADYQGTLSHRGGAFVFGYRHERQGGLISGRDAGRHNNGGFVHEQYSIGRRVYLTGGARVENSTTFGTRFVPRGSATLQLSGGHGAFSSTFLRVSAGRGFTEPSLLQNFARELYYVGNPLLKPEKTAMFDTGIVQELFSRRVRAEVTYFRNSFQDLIVYDGTQSPASWSNIDRSRARGVETSFVVRPFKNVQVSGNFTRLHTKVIQTNSFSVFTAAGQELPRRPKNSGSVWISITPRRWALMAGVRAVGERQDGDYVFGVTRNPGFNTVFANASFDLNRHVTPYFRLDNALNERYQEALGYWALTRGITGGVRVAW